MQTHLLLTHSLPVGTKIIEQPKQPPQRLVRNTGSLQMFLAEILACIRTILVGMFLPVCLGGKKLSWSIV